jgi:hypothetical protein
MVSSIAEVEQVCHHPLDLDTEYLNLMPSCSSVKGLYVPGSPKKIGKIQETLQRLQRSPEGWQMADALLSCDDDKVRFLVL